MYNSAKRKNEMPENHGRFTRKGGARRAVAMILALLMAVVMLPTAAAVEYGAENAGEKNYEEKFSDVPRSQWAFNYVAELSERGAINGYPDGKFRPSLTVSRAEFTKIMCVAAGLSPTNTDTVSFADVPKSYWAHPFLETTREYMTGYKNGDQYLFKPENAALREDIAVAVVKMKGYDTRFADLSIPKAMFKDYDSISESLRPYVALAVENGIISGYDDETFRAQNSITRAEAAAMLWRAFQYGNDNKVADIGGDTPNDDIKPEPTPTPTPTPEPTPTTTPTPDSVPTQEDKPAQNAYTHSMDTVASVSGGMIYGTLVTNRADDIFYLSSNLSVMTIRGGRETLVADRATILANAPTVEFTAPDGTTAMEEFVSFVPYGLVSDDGGAVLLLGLFDGYDSDYLAAYDVNNLSSPIMLSGKTVKHVIYTNGTECVFAHNSIYFRSHADYGTCRFDLLNGNITLFSNGETPIGFFDGQPLKTANLSFRTTRNGSYAYVRAAMYAKSGQSLYFVGDDYSVGSFSLYVSDNPASTSPTATLAASSDKIKSSGAANIYMRDVSQMTIENDGDVLFYDRGNGVIWRLSAI
jgi:hypothetical protein